MEALLGFRGPDSVITWINVRGIQMVGQVATALEIFIFVRDDDDCDGFMKWHHNPFVPLIPPHQPTFKIFGVGLALGCWLYSGYEQLSTVAEEVENPQRLTRGRWRWWCRSRLRLFSAHAGGAGFGGRVEEVAYRIFFGRARMIVDPYLDDLAGHVDDAGGMWERRAAEQHLLRRRACLLPWRRTVSSRGAHAQAFAVWDAVAGDSGVAVIYALLAWQSLGH